MHQMGGRRGARFDRGGCISVCSPHRRYLPAKVRVFVDFLVQWFRTREIA